jgi:hypothetical protein
VAQNPAGRRGESPIQRVPAEVQTVVLPGYSGVADGERWDDSNEYSVAPGSDGSINTSRGPVIDEPDPVKALREEWLAGAAMDVFENEPLPGDSPLRSMDNCLLAPHNSNSSPGAKLRVNEDTVRNLLAVLQSSD